MKMEKDEFKELKKEIRRAVKIYICFWCIVSLIMILILLKKFNII